MNGNNLGCVGFIEATWPSPSCEVTAIDASIIYGNATLGSSEFRSFPYSSTLQVSLLRVGPDTGGIGGIFRVNLTMSDGSTCGPYNVGFFVSDNSSSSSGSFNPCTPSVPCRECVRLLQPDPRNIEQFCDDALTITTYWSADLLQNYYGALPNSGPDTLLVRYFQNGQYCTASVNVTLWASDGGWCYIGTDGAQYLITARDPLFYDAFALIVNARNVANGATPLTTCCDVTQGYGWLKKIPNYPLTSVWIKDGIVMV